MADTKGEPGTLGPRALAAAISAAVTGTAMAQNAGGLEEIIVTATRRAERIQDIPESISAFDDKAIASRGMQQLDDYAKYVPGLSLGIREPGGTTIVFRGVTPAGAEFGAVASAGLYLDEQPITLGGRNPDPRLIDIERLEALRGPQGTLYGASSQSGTLRVITNKPNPEAFDAWTEGLVSQTHSGDPSYDLSGMVNIPLVSDKLAVRFVGFTAEDGGFIDNVLAPSQGGTFTNSANVDENVNSARTTGGRAALRWDINDAVSATVSALFQDLSTDGHGDVNPGIAGDLQQVRFNDENLDDNWYQLALTLTAALPIGDAVFAASYFNRDFRYEADATDYEFAFNQLSINYDTVAYDFGGDPRGYATNHEKTQITTFEARLASPAASDSRWAWLGGVFYSRDTGKSSFNSYVQGYADTPSFASFAAYDLAPTDIWFLGRYDTELDEFAIFGELSYDLTEKFTITAGGRWFDYTRRFTQHQEQPQGLATLDGQQETSENGTVGKFNVTYRFDPDHLVYFTYSEGFRVGGNNPLRPDSLLPEVYSSDTLHNYEIGAKTEWLDHRVRVNLAAYFMQWDNFSVQIEDPQPNVFQLGFVNFPSADITGVEGDFAVQISEHWSLDGSASWNNAEISQTATFTVTDSDGVSYPFTVEKGQRLPLTPDWTAALGIEYRSGRNVMNGEPFARFDYAYVGNSVNSLENFSSSSFTSPVYEQPSYQTGDFRVGLESDAWTASLFVDNLWDERGQQFFSTRWVTPRLSINRPRTVGAQLRYRF